MENLSKFKIPKFFNTIHNMSFAMKQELLEEELNFVKLNLINTNNEIQINKNKQKILIIKEQLQNLKNQINAYENIIQNQTKQTNKKTSNEINNHTNNKKRKNTKTDLLLTNKKSKT